MFGVQKNIETVLKGRIILKVLQLLGDVTKKEVCEELVDKTLNHFGELDVLVRLQAASTFYNTLHTVVIEVMLYFGLS